MGLSKRDIAHLEKFKVSLGSNHPISTGEIKGSYSELSGKKFYARVVLVSQYMVDALASHQILEKKSLTHEVCIGKIPNSLQRDFWRGMVDGDGCVYLSKRGAPELHLCGTHQAVTEFKNFMTREGLGSSAEVRSIGKIFNISYGGSHLCPRALDILYTGSSIFLDRKKETADRIISNEGPPKRRNWSHVTRDQLLQLHEEMGNWTQVAYKLNTTRQHIRYLRRSRGI